MRPLAPEFFRRARSHFEDITDLPLEEREERLEALAAEEPALAAAVRSLMDADSQAGTFLEEPAGGFAPELVAEVFPAAEAEPALSVVRAGPYRLLSLLGRGGMGEVYLAERADGQYQQQVAVKLLKRGMDSEEVVRRFLRERQILARLEHPHIARLLDGGMAEDGRPYFVLEKVDGQPITSYAREKGLGVDAAVRLMITSARAVEAAHRKFVVHRDLKPSNILVDQAGQVKLLDFGIAKLLDADATLASQLTTMADRALTPAYAAPEQILDEPVSAATDVYALGVILYELATGQLPHERVTRSVAELASRLEGETIDRPSTVVRRQRGELFADAERRAKRLAGDLDTILLKALHREPERRYASAGALADDLERFLAGRPVEARPDSRTYRTAKFVGRHRLAVAAGIAVFAALALSFGMALASAREARLEAARADSQAARAEVATQRAQRVKEFVVGLLREASPVQRERDQPLSTAELIERGLAKAEAELSEEPELLAEVLTDFAQLWGNIGQPERGMPLAERAVELGRARGDDPAILAQGLTAIADLALMLGQYERAEGAAAEGLALVRARAAEESLAVAEAKDNLVSAYHHQGRQEEALHLARQVLVAFEALLGAEDLRTIDRMQNLGAMLTEAGDIATAEPLLERSLEALRRVRGEGHVRTAYARMNLAELKARRGRLAEAEALVRTAVDQLRSGHGREHVMVAAAVRQLGGVLFDRGRLAEARAAYMEALSILERLKSYGVPMLKTDLARLEVSEGRLGEAEALLAEIIPALARQGADRESSLLAAQALEAEIWLARREAARAEERLGHAAERLAELVHPPDPSLARIWLLLGRARRELGRGEEALALHERAASVIRRDLPPEHWRSAEVERELALDRQALAGR